VQLHFCQLFNLLLLNLIHLFWKLHNNGIILKPPISFHGRHKYIEVHNSQLSIGWILFF
jgi:hypothetical protein